MGTSKCSCEFGAVAVALYHSSPGGTYASVAKDLGVNHGTLRMWVRDAGQAARPGAVEAIAMEEENRQLRARVRELGLEREILRRAAKYFGGRDLLVSSRFQFVEDHRGVFGVKRLCRILVVSRSGFCRWLAGGSARAGRARADAGLAEHIGRIHQESDGTCGVPRVTAGLKDSGRRVSHKRVERVMRTFRIVGPHLRKKVRTAIPEPSATPVPDLLRRDFAAREPNTKYVGDITCLPIGNGQFLYLATVLGLCSKRLTGWSMAGHMRTSLVTDALRAAAGARGGDGLRGAISHSDNGAQYVSKEFAQVCSELGVTRSRGAVGTSADNAAAESLNATRKRETLQGRKRWNGASEARLAVFRWATRYNTRRRHSRLGQISPITYEQRSTTLATAA
ncbi:IS3 family transposase [Streptomyces malaysiensis]|uniref:IS3 family transposase n=1 Tax=Streptomyces malaysiensis TaxID=92644 RepID=UPI002B30787B|nr:IS3 family transposase [Streptomyces malaysiensis]